MAEPNTKKLELEDSNRGHGKFHGDWMKMFLGIIDVSKLDSTYAFCKICCKDIKVVASGLYDIKMEKVFVLCITKTTPMQNKKKLLHFQRCKNCLNMWLINLYAACCKTVDIV